jgi:hypothetical protein
LSPTDAEIDSLFLQIKQMAIVVRQTPQKKDYTREELKQYDGKDPTKAILVALKGTIYDVTK